MRKGKRRDRVDVRTLYLCRATNEQLPFEIAARIAAIAEQDRLWFEQHPGARHYLRPAVADEFWPQKFGNVRYVVVVAITSARHVRVPVIDEYPECAATEQ